MSLLSVRPGDAAVSLPDYVPPACAPVRTLGDRLLPAWRHVVSTPGRAVWGTVGALAALTALGSLQRVTVYGTDATGPYRAECGLDSYLVPRSGDVGALCRSAYMPHARLFFLALMVLVVASLWLWASVPGPDEGRVAQVRLVLRRSVSTSLRAAALTVAAAGWMLAYLAAWPVTVHLADDRGALVAQCGLGFVVAESGNAVVDESCADAYATRLDLLVAGVALGAAGLGTAFAGRLSPSEHRRGDDDAGA